VSSGLIAYVPAVILPCRCKFATSSSNTAKFLLSHSEHFASGLWQMSGIHSFLIFQDFYLALRAPTLIRHVASIKDVNTLKMVNLFIFVTPPGSIQCRVPHPNRNIFQRIPF